MDRFETHYGFKTHSVMANTIREAMNKFAEMGMDVKGRMYKRVGTKKTSFGHFYNK